MLATGCASAPWINEVDAPPREDTAVAAGLAAIDEYAPIQGADYMAIEPDITWVDQERIVVEDGFGREVSGAGMTWPSCRIVIVLDPDLGEDPDLGRTTLGHELIHCAHEHAGHGLDRTHEDAAWWGRKSGELELAVNQAISAAMLD